MVKVITELHERPMKEVIKNYTIPLQKPFRLLEQH